MAQPPIAGPRTGAYSSPSIRARRRRILEEARKLIAKQGLAGLSMEEVCTRAGVAKRTLYNAFQSKERMIAAAIHQYFEDYAARLPTLPENVEIDEVLERLVVLARRNIEISNYSHALMTIYHSHDVDQDIWREIHEIGLTGHKPWIDTLKRKRQLRSWIDADELSEQLVRVRFAIGNAWAQHRFGDTMFPYHLVQTLLTYMAGATRGVALTEIESRLQALAAGTLTIAGVALAVPERDAERAAD